MSTASLRRLSRPALLSLAEALESDWLQAPFSPSDLRRLVPKESEDAVSAELREMAADGMRPAHVVRLLRAVAEERKALQAIADRVELVWSGIEEPGSMTRDTSVVVQELFRSARESVLISSFVVEPSSRGRTKLRPLGEGGKTEVLRPRPGRAGSATHAVPDPNGVKYHSPG